MLELKGKYNIAKIFTDNIEETAISQIIQLCNQEFVSNSQIRIMPDVHAGAGCVIERRVINYLRKLILKPILRRLILLDYHIKYST